MIEGPTSSTKPTNQPGPDAQRGPYGNERVTLSARTANSELLIAFQCVDGGLHVERSQGPSSGPQVEQSFYIEDMAAFNRWSETDNMRFTHPALHIAVKRYANERLGW